MAWVYDEGIPRGGAMWIVTQAGLSSTHSYGLFGSAARAAGWAFMHFGDSVIGRWKVVPIRRTER